MWGYVHFNTSELALSLVEHGSFTWAIGSVESNISAHVCDTFMEGLVWFNGAEARAKWAFAVLEQHCAGAVLLGTFDMVEGLGSVGSHTSAQKKIHTTLNKLKMCIIYKRQCWEKTLEVAREIIEFNIRYTYDLVQLLAKARTSLVLVFWLVVKSSRGS